MNAYFCKSIDNVPSSLELVMEISRDERFVPKGAIAFFIVLLVGYAMLWLAMYVELLRRG